MQPGNAQKILLINLPLDETELMQQSLSGKHKDIVFETDSSSQCMTAIGSFLLIIIKLPIPSATLSTDIEHIISSADNTPLLILGNDQELKEFNLGNYAGYCEKLSIPASSDGLQTRVRLLVELAKKIKELRFAKSRKGGIKNEEQCRMSVQIPMPFLITDINGHILFVNKEFERQYGYLKKEVPTIHQWFDKIYKNQKDREKTEAKWLLLLEKIKLKKGHLASVRQYFVLYNKAGRKIYTEIHLTQGKAINYIVLKDITRELIGYRYIKKLSEAINQSPAAIAIADKRGNIEFINRQFSLITEYTIEDVLGKNPQLSPLNNASSEITKSMIESATQGVVWQNEYFNYTKYGRKYWEKTTIAPMKNKNGATVNFIIIVEDITEKKGMTEVLMQSEQSLKEANATKDKFISIIAHDLRNSIGAIMNLSEILLRDKQLSNESRVYTEHIRMSSNSTFALLEDLLNWARATTGSLRVNWEEFNVRCELTYASMTLKNMWMNKNIDFTLLTDTKLTACGDIKLFHTIIRNLISNAIKFTKNGGHITISATPKDNMVEISISDTGIGIEPDRINDMFFAGKNYTTAGTANEMGTGMGLPLSWEFVSKMGGEMLIESQLGKGTTVRFTVPTKIKAIENQQ